MVGAFEADSGFPLAFAYTFLAPHGAPNASAPAATAVVVLRHGAFPITLDKQMWRKYKIGEAFKIIDPETEAPAVEARFLRPKPGVLLVEDMALDRLLRAASCSAPATSRSRCRARCSPPTAA